MSFEIVAFDELREKLIKSLEKLVRSHKSDFRAEVDKLEDNLAHIPDDKNIKRQSQARVLFKCVDLIKAMPSQTDSDKQTQAKILNSVAYYFYHVIEAYYGSTSKAESSNLYVSLRTSLNVGKDNSPDKDEELEMFKEFNNFLHKHIYKKNANNQGDPQKGYLDLQAFDSKYAVSIVKDLRAKIYEIETQFIDRAEKLFKKTHSKPKSFLGGIFGSSAKKSSDETVAEKATNGM